MTPKQVATLLRKCQAQGNDLFEVRDELRLNGKLGRETLGGIDELLASAEQLSLSVSVIDEAGDVVERHDMLNRADQTLHVTIAKPNTAATVYCFTPQGVHSVLNDSATVPTQIVVADLASPFATIRCRFSEWEATVSDHTIDDPTTAVRWERYVNDLAAAGQIPIGMLIIRDLPAAESAAYQTWRAWAVGRLRNILVSEVRNDSVLLRGKRTLTLDATIPAALGDGDLKIASEAAEWIYAESERDIEARHTFFVDALSLEWQTDSIPWFEGVRRYGKPALESARQLYRGYLSDTTSDTLKSRTDLHKNLSDEVSKVVGLTRDLQTALWRDLAIGAAAIFARVTGAAQNPFVTEAIIWAAVVFLLLSISTALCSNKAFLEQAALQRASWRTLLYPFLTQEEYDKLATDAIHKATDTYRNVALTVGFAYGAMAVLLLISLFFHSPQAPNSASTSSMLTTTSSAPGQQNTRISPPLKNGSEKNGSRSKMDAQKSASCKTRLKTCAKDP